MKITYVLLPLLAAFSLLSSCGIADREVSMNDEGRIFCNQVGYLCGEEKSFLTNLPPLRFSLIDSRTGEVKFEGRTEIWADNDSASGLSLSRGDFSGFDEPGDYRIHMGKNLTSHPFRISDDIYNDVRDISLKSYYYQRSGMALEKEYAGSFHRLAGHVEPLEYHQSSSVSGRADVSGGWYDAGDFGRYITPGAVSLGIMMTGYELYPQKFLSDNTGLPESGNGVPDFLDEMRYELQWMLKMQYKGDGEFLGALPYMVNSRDYVWEIPHINSQPQLIYEFSSVATADFAAVAAQAYRLFEPHDREFAEECLQAAEMAWSFLDTHEAFPDGGYKRPDDTVTGGYADSASNNREDGDDRTWAAVELLKSTGKKQYGDYAVPELKKVKYISGNMNWINTMGFAQISYLFARGDLFDKELQNELKNQLLTYCEKLLEIIDREGFQVALRPDEYTWGSNGEVMTRACFLLYGFLQSDDDKYRRASLHQLNYILGTNPVGISYVSALGTVSPGNIHHAAMANDGIADPFPGFVAGGPNNRLHGDYTLPKHFDSSTPPALCYIDHVDSWASNENCILYNAPLIPLAAFFSET